MSTLIKIVVADITLDAELFDTPCGHGITDLLPFDTFANTWGDEFYFENPLKHGPDDTATSDVEIGDIGYWPPGRALAIFFGPTPMSVGPKPVPASDVNIVGRIIGDARLLKGVRGVARIKIEKNQEAKRG